MYNKAVINGIRLAEDAICHIVASVDAIAFVQHIISLGSFRVVRPILVNVRLDVGQEIGAIAGLLESGSEPGEVASVRRKFLSEQG